ncbi:YchJ family protein [Yersinia rochesterensis]|uniref:YchJ family protein n=1 Tax=Yersinia rochesterensis TaxID=1604335 RepID=UPI0011A50D62|nr:YchJ family protein [Yersinia rochesterensis]MDN0105520.1 YchJ family protein [Yersinia rochesterensis]MDR5020210.1 YchJ family protein [Yersinia rochesterensis]
MSEQCPCGSTLEYQECCEPYILGTQVAVNPAILMRSRYSAYVKKNVDYLVNTWHPDCNAQKWRDGIIQSFNNTTWHGLTVIAEIESDRDDEAFVEFIARFSDTNNTDTNNTDTNSTQISSMHERSRFLRINEHWYYIDGIRPSVGRNDACPCGSGKKHKKCCGR